MRIRFEKLLCERLGVEVHKEDELATVVHGVAFMLENSVDELYAIEHSRYDTARTLIRFSCLDCLIATVSA